MSCNADAMIFSIAACPNWATLCAAFTEVVGSDSGPLGTASALTCSMTCILFPGNISAISVRLSMIAVFLNTKRSFGLSLGVIKRPSNTRERLSLESGFHRQATVDEVVLDRLAGQGELAVRVRKLRHDHHSHEVLALGQARRA